MSRINGEKARAGIARKRRTAQREKDREARAVIASATPAPVAKAPATTPASKPASKPAPKKAAKKADARETAGS